MFGCNFSMLNYDTVAGGVFGSLRLGWNAGMMHASVYPSLFTYPTMDFGGFSPYQQYTTSNWLLDPGFALQATFMNMQNYGCFGGGMVAPQSPWTTLGNLPITPKTAEEKAQEQEYNDLKAIAKEVVKKMSSDAEITALKAAIDATEGTVQERIDSLKTELGKDAAINAAKELLLNPTDAIKVGTIKLSTILKGLGLGNKPNRSKISDMNTAVSRTSGDISPNEVSGLNISTENVLLYMEGMEVANINKLKDEKNKNLYNEIIENLVDLARELVDSEELDDKLQENLDNCRQRFSGENKNTATIDDFKNLYACCLLGASQLADKKVNDGTFYDDIVGHSVYTNKAKETLKNKDFADNSITQALTGAVNISDVPYDPTQSRHYISMTFSDNTELQASHNKAAAVIAEIADADPASLEFIPCDEQIKIKLADGRYVQFAFDDSGKISSIWVDYQDGGTANGADISYFTHTDGSYYVSATLNDTRARFTNGVKLENGNDFTKLQSACNDLVEVARTELAKQGEEQDE